MGVVESNQAILLRRAGLEEPSRASCKRRGRVEERIPAFHMAL